jgi:hypothetical protein
MSNVLHISHRRGDARSNGEDYGVGSASGLRGRDRRRIVSWMQQYLALADTLRIAIDRWRARSYVMFVGGTVTAPPA